MKQLLLAVTLLASRLCVAEERIDVWPDLAPGETTRMTGEKQSPIANENPPVTRVVNITRHTFTVHLAPKLCIVGLHERRPVHQPATR